MTGECFYTILTNYDRMNLIVGEHNSLIWRWMNKLNGETNTRFHRIKNSFFNAHRRPKVKLAPKFVVFKNKKMNELLKEK